MPSPRFIQAVTSQNSGECDVLLVTIEHASFPEPLRYCTGGANIVSTVLDGEGEPVARTFTARAMKIAAPGDSADRNGRRGRITIDNVEPDAIGRLRTAPSQPDVTVELILASYPDDIEMAWRGLKLLDQRPNGSAIELDIGPRDDSVHAFPYQAYTPNRTEGLFD